MTTRQTRRTQPNPPSAHTLGLLTLGGVLVAGGAFVARRLLRRASRGAEHSAPDLALDRPRPGPDDRAPDAFRPDPTAAVPASEREGLRPATGPAPTLVGGGPNDVERTSVAPG